MLRKLLLSPWFGPPPPWWPRYQRNSARLADHGYTLLVPTDLADFYDRVERTLGLPCSVTPGAGKVHDYRPALGVIYADLIDGHDFWGHTDLDCVYGRVEEFWPDELLDSTAVAVDHTHHVCGPWTLYRGVQDLFREHPGWQDELTNPAVTGWAETSFTVLLRESGTRVMYRLTHGYQYPELYEWDGDRLMEGKRERSFFHFRHSKRWPKGLM
jgi:hypothetical protein